MEFTLDHDKLVENFENAAQLQVFSHMENGRKQTSETFQVFSISFSQQKNHLLLLGNL